MDLESHQDEIHAGEEILLLYGAANRDPRAFTDPDVLDVTRPQNRHVAFRLRHPCLPGCPTISARLEISILFEEMLRRMPDWELIDPDEPKIMPATFARAYDTIRIRFTPSR